MKRGWGAVGPATAAYPTGKGVEWVASSISGQRCHDRGYF
jgi:hypothetical protein